MNKKITLSLLSTMTLAGLAFAAGNNVNAAGTDTQTHMSTDTEISFYDTNKPNPGPFEGYLSFVYAPGNFNFGANEVNTTSASYSMKYTAQPSKQKYVAVSDDRVAADKKGWELKASLGEFKDATGEIGVESAELSFTPENTQKYNFEAGESDKLQTPTPAIDSADALSDLSKDLVMKDLYTVSPEVVLVSNGGAKTVITSKQPEANADASPTMAVATEINNAKLTVKDHSKVSNRTFTSTISWDLTADVQP